MIYPAASTLVQARTFLDNLPDGVEQKCPAEINKMKCAKHELETADDPTSKNAHTLSRRRTEQLERTLTRLMNTIMEECAKEYAKEKVMLSPAASQSQAIDSLVELIGDLSWLDPKELHNRIKMLPYEVRRKIYEIVWLASRCPQELDFSKHLLRSDKSILEEVFPSQLGAKPGTLLNQVLEDLRFESQLNKERGKLNALREVAQGLNNGQPVSEIESKLSELGHPLPMSSEKEDVPAAGSEEHKKEMLNHVNQLIDDCQWHINDLTEGRVRFFKDALERYFGTSIRMRDLFKYMHQEVQNRLRAEGIEPPFFGYGLDMHLYETLGAHYNAATGRTMFRVYAPNAEKIILHLTAYGKVQHEIPLVRGRDGIWFADTDQAPPGRSYYFMVTAKNIEDGKIYTIRKMDPFAFQTIMHTPEIRRDIHEGIVTDLDQPFEWTDDEWVKQRSRSDFTREPLMIYELHPTWMLKENGQPLNWRELAPLLAEYCKNNYYNAVELLGAFSHTDPMSMGYQVSGFYSCNSEHGTWRDFQYFVNYMHNVELTPGRKGIRVFLDWVPGHFAVDQFSLSMFDGTPLFEDSDPMFRTHPHWGAFMFDYKKTFPKAFLAALANFIVEVLHAELRFDAVESTAAQLDYGREDQPGRKERVNKRGEKVNLEAMKHFRHLNYFLSKRHPGVLKISEGAHYHPNLTRSVEEKGTTVKRRGVGFDGTWDFEIGHLLLPYFQQGSAEERARAFQALVKFLEGRHKSHNFPDGPSREYSLLTRSHDEVTAHKGTIVQHMLKHSADASEADKFANGRLYAALFHLHGSITLDFMGNDFLQKEGWTSFLAKNLEAQNQKDLSKVRPTVQWDLLTDRAHQGALACSRDLKRMNMENSALWDHTEEGFRWIHADCTNCVLAFHRRSTDGKRQVACIFNTLDRDFTDYCIPLPKANYAPELDRLVGIKEVLNTDDQAYGGEGRTNASVEILRDEVTGRPTEIKLGRLPPYTAIVLEEEFS